MSRPPERLDANAATLHAYGQAMDRWLEASSEEVGGMLLAFLEQVVAMTPAGGSVLEIGSGSGCGEAARADRSCQRRTTVRACSISAAACRIAALSSLGVTGMTP